MAFDVRGEFPLPSPEEWRLAAEKLLKGAPFDKVLRTETYDGLILDPIYNETKSDFDPALLNGWDGEGRNWDIAQALPYPSPADFNTALKADLMRGQNTVLLRIDQAGVRGLDRTPENAEFVGLRGTSITSLNDLRAALDDIELTACPIRIEAGNSTSLYLPMFVALLAERGIDPKNVTGTIAMDPLGAAVSGCPLPRKWAWDEQAAMLRWAIDNHSPLRVVRVSGLPYAEAGANAVQELAYVFATGAETLHQLTERGFTVAQILPHLEFSLGLGSQFFAEIAKLRALRLAWAEILRRFGASANLYLHTTTVSYNKTAYDPWVNLLRTTTEALSGVIGGTDSLEIVPFDTAVRLPDEFSRRLARNMHAMFREESAIHRVIDPAGGTYFVEHLTTAFANKALEMLGQIEDAGGMEKYLESGAPQQAVRDIAAKRIRNANIRKDVFIGLNMFPNLKEKELDENPVELPEDIDATIAPANDDASIPGMVTAYQAGATVGGVSRINHPHTPAEHAVAMLLPFRVVNDLETLRQKLQPMAVPVFLAGMGPLSQFKARMDFSAGFFAVAGYKTIPTKGFSTPEEAAEAAVASGANIAVLCSTDDTYPELVPPFVAKLKALKPGMTAILAGFPKDQIEAHKAAGIDEFIHVRADVYAILSGLAKGVLA
jgi:methylmalonyl-CoA mutase